MNEAAITKLYTKPFVVLLLSGVLFSMSFSMILAELPAYLTSLGGEDYKGLIISLFSLSAALSRPFSGKLTDTIGRVPVMVFGTVVSVFASFLYPFLTSVFGFLFLRFFHGMATGFKPTAAVAFIADIVPSHRRGEALGIAGVSGNVGLSGGPIVGSYLMVNYSINTMFFAASIVAVISVLILFGLKETLENRQKFSPKLLNLNRTEILSTKAFPPAIVTAMLYIPFGVVLTIVPDQSEFLGLTNKGLAFGFFTAFSVISRLVAGKTSDMIGRLPVIYLSVVGLIVALITLGYARTSTQLLLSIGGLGFTLGIGIPTVFAWTIDLVSDQERGKALGTVYLALELGIGMGALMSGYIYNNQAEMFKLTFLITALVSGMAAPYLFYLRRMMKSSKLDV